MLKLQKVGTTEVKYVLLKFDVPQFGLGNGTWSADAEDKDVVGGVKGGVAVALEVLVD